MIMDFIKTVWFEIWLFVGQLWTLIAGIDIVGLLSSYPVTACFLALLALTVGEAILEDI